MLYLILLLNEHRTAVAWVIALVIWVSAYGWYFRHMILAFFRRGQAHNWSIDMVTKKTVTNGKEEVY